MIERKPEEFKIAALSDVKKLFPKNPFFSGFGNRETVSQPTFAPFLNLNLPAQP